jgi:integrase
MNDATAQRGAVDAALKRRVSRPQGRRRGGVRKVRDGVWRVDVETKRDPVTQRRRRVSKTVYGTREDAEIALAKLRIAAHERRLRPKGTSARSVAAIFELYLSSAEAGAIELSPRTLVTARSATKTMAATVMGDGRAFGDLSLSRLGWQEIEEVYRAMRVRGLGSAWVRRCATVLAQALEHARKRGLIDANPAKDAARPRSARRKPVAPTFGELSTALTVARARDEEIADAVVILASTGMRKGELLALRWSDADLVRDEVHVSASIVDGGPGVGVVRKATKRADWRDIPLTVAALEALERQRARMLTPRDVGRWESSYVFPATADGARSMRPDTFTDRWTAARGASTITLQQVRHYAATAMLDSGESYRTVADLLGNSESTLRLHYDGRTDVGKRRAIKALELARSTRETVA